MASGSTAVSAINVAGPPTQHPPAEPRHAKHTPGTQPAAGNKDKPWADIPWSELTVPIAVLSVILAMIVPLPSWLLDFLMHSNLPLFFNGSPQVGLGLENSGTGLLFMTVLDILLLAVGIAIYFRARKRTQKIAGEIPHS